jgi:surface antigen
MKTILAVLAMLPIVAFADTPTLCDEQSRTEHFRNKNGVESVRTITETVCVDKSRNMKRAGLLNGICGVPSRIDPALDQRVVSCIKPDNTWEQFNVAPWIDKTSVDPNQEIILPNYYDYGRGDAFGFLAGLVVGGYYSLNESQKAAHTEAIITALKDAELGQKVTWRLGDVGGYATPVATFPSSQGYCRRVHVYLFNSKKTNALSKTACFENSSESWRWISDKY